MLVQQKGLMANIRSLPLKQFRYTQAKVETAIRYYWKLKAIDSIISTYRELPTEECQRIIDNIIDNDEIKEMLVSKNSDNKSTSTALANTAYQQTHQTNDGGNIASIIHR